MKRIKVRSYRIALPKSNKPNQPIRMAVIGDLHNKVFGEANNDLVQTILGLLPDLVCSVGDLTVCKAGKKVDPDVGLSLLKRLSCACPVYCINGNHEFRAKQYPTRYKGVYEKMTSEFQRMGIRLLEDECEFCEIKGARLAMYGFELPEKYYKRGAKSVLPAQEIREHLGEPAEGSFRILLAHNPLYFESYALWGADLTLCGHFHGGLVRLPFIGGVISPQLQLFPKYDCGLFSKYRRKMVVTAGLGTHSFAFRFNNPAEVTLLELY